MKTVTVTLPAFWASYLINNDNSNMTETEQRDCAAYLKQHGLREVDCVDCAETTHTEAFDGDGFIYELAEFTFQPATTDSWAEMMAAARELEAESSDTMHTLTCNMKKDCDCKVSHIDARGFIYCAKHAALRTYDTPTRKLTATELQQLTKGHPVSRF